MNNDDGSLAFLNIPRDEKSRSFNCEQTSQSKLVNTTFWVVDFLERVPTRFSKSKQTEGQTLVMVKKEKDAPESEARKFFTGSQEILYILQESISSASARGWVGLSTAIVNIYYKQ